MKIKRFQMPRRWTFEVIIVISVWEFAKMKSQAQPVANPKFVRSCGDPLVQEHLMTSMHSYCYHACGYFSNDISPENDTSSCTPNGNCLCNYPCSNNATIIEPTIMFDTGPGGVCPPDPSDAPDPDPNALSNCMTTCATQCPGGLGMICGETALIGTNRDTYAKICTCYCPPQRCPLNATATTTQQSYILKKPIGLIFKIIAKNLFLKSFLIKAFKLCWLLFKVSSLYLLNSLMVGLYSYIFYQWISREDLQLFRPIFTFINYFSDFDYSHF